MFKQIRANIDINGTLNKEFVLVSQDCVEYVSYEDFKSSPLPDMTERDAFGGIVY